MVLSISTDICRPADSSWRVDFRTITTYAGLYSILVFYELCHRFMLEHWFSDVWGYFHFFYDPDRAATYLWICFLTPLALLPAGTRLATASQVIFSIFMTFVALPTPLYFVHFIAADSFPYAYACFFASYFILAVAARLQLPFVAQPLGERAYRRLLALTVLLMVVVFAYGVTQNFQLVNFAQLYVNRYSEDVNGVLVQRIITLYVFSFSGLFLATALMFKRYRYILPILVGYVLCYGMIYEKSALLAPAWIIYSYFASRFFSGTSTVRFYLVLMAPFLAGVAWYAVSPGTAKSTGNLVQFVYMGTVLFRLYSIPANAAGLYHQFFASHPPTYWSHITGINFFVHYPYGDHTIAVEMERYFSLGNYNANFMASDAIEAYGYQALPLAALAVGAIFVFLNTAARGFGVRTLVVLMVMPSLAICNVPFATTLTSSGILFLAIYLFLMPREWLARSSTI
jgi:hypothetical protein